jgi:hypothetical protein
MNVPPAERPQVMNLLARIGEIETRTNLAAIGAALAAAK